MGNVISSFLSGFGNVIGNLFGSPFDFLSGNSCSSVCQSTWDFICFIENFCVAHLLKMAMVLFLLYIVLLLFYLLYKVGICDCIGHGICKTIWACLVCYLSVCKYFCNFLCFKLPWLWRRNKNKDFDHTNEQDDEEDRFAYKVERKLERRKSKSCRWKELRKSHLRKSLKPRSHGVETRIKEKSVHRHIRISFKHHDIRADHVI